MIPSPTNIEMENKWDMPMKDYVVLDPTTMDTGIVTAPINAAQYEFKPMMFQMH